MKKARRRDRDHFGFGPPTGRLSAVLRWVGALTAVLTLIFGLYQLTNLISDSRARKREVAELEKLSSLQKREGDYANAWDNLEQAAKVDSGTQLAKLFGQQSRQTREVEIAREDLAMAWLEEVSLVHGQTFTEVVNKLEPVLRLGADTSSGARKADLLAHLGWADFLHQREVPWAGHPKQYYLEAIKQDPQNPYANANLGHWELWSNINMPAARRDFAAALASGRARDYVRKTQLAALQNHHDDECEEELLRVVNDMRRNHEPVDDRTRSRVWALYYFADSGEHSFKRLIGAVPASEQAATFRALFYDADFDESKRAERDIFLAILLEAAGEREAARNSLRTMRKSLPPDSDWASRTDAMIKRLSENP